MVIGALDIRFVFVSDLRLMAEESYLINLDAAHATIAGPPVLP